MNRELALNLIAIRDSLILGHNADSIPGLGRSIPWAARVLDEAICELRAPDSESVSLTFAARPIALAPGDSVIQLYAPGVGWEYGELSKRSEGDAIVTHWAWPHDMIIPGVKLP